MARQDPSWLRSTSQALRHYAADTGTHEGTCARANRATILITTGPSCARARAERAQTVASRRVGSLPPCTDSAHTLHVRRRQVKLRRRAVVCKAASKAKVQDALKISIDRGATAWRVERAQHSLAGSEHSTTQPEERRHAKPQGSCGRRAAVCKVASKAKVRTH